MLKLVYRFHFVSTSICPHVNALMCPLVIIFILLEMQVYATSDVLEANSAVHCPRLEMASRSKLSCVSWNSYIKHLLLAADYDGCLALWDAEANACTATFEEHAKRVWSADFCQVLPISLQGATDFFGRSMRFFDFGVSSVRSSHRSADLIGLASACLAC